MAKGKSNNHKRQFIFHVLKCPCYLCGQPFRNPDTITFDHVEPRKDGNKRHNNLMPAHTKCNYKKGSRPPTASEIRALAIFNEEMKPFYNVTERSRLLAEYRR